MNQRVDEYFDDDDLPDGALIEFRARWLRLLFARHALAYVAVWAFVWGLLVLSGRIWQGQLSLAWLVASVGTIPALWLAWWRALSQMPSDDAIRIWLDQHRGQGGLYMAQGEADIGQWSRQVDKAPLPALQWRGHKYWALLFLAAMFVAGSFVTPQKWFPAYARDRLHIEDQVTKLSQQIKTLKKEKILSPKKAKSLQQQLNQLKRNARGSDPAQTLQGLEQLRQQNKEAASRAAEQAAAQIERWNQIQRMAKALSQHGKKLPATERKEAIRRLQRQVKQALRASTLSPSQRKALRKAIQQAQAANTPRSGSQKSGGQKLGGQKSGNQKSGSQKSGSQKSGARGSMSPSAARRMARQMGRVGQMSQRAKQGLRQKLQAMARAGLLPKDSPHLRKSGISGQQGKPGKAGHKPGSSSTPARAGKESPGSTGKSGAGKGNKPGQKIASGQSAQAGKSGKSGKSGQSSKSGQSGQSGQSGKSGKSGQSGAGKSGGQAGAGGQKGQGRQGGKAGTDGQAGAGKPGGRGRGAGASPTRGGGATPLTWKGATETRGARFKLLSLPQDKLNKLRRFVAGETSEPKGRRKRRRRKRRKKRVQHGALEGAKTRKSAAQTHAIAPQYWGTIKRYFKRGESGTTPDPRATDKKEP